MRCEKAGTELNVACSDSRQINLVKLICSSMLSTYVASLSIYRTIDSVSSEAFNFV